MIEVKTNWKCQTWKKVVINFSRWVKHSVPPIQSFLIDCRKTWAQVFSMAHQKERKYLKQPMEAQRKNNQTAQSAGKRGRQSCDWFQFCIWLEESGVSFVTQLQSKLKQKQSNCGLLSTLNWKLIETCSWWILIYYQGKWWWINF